MTGGDRRDWWPEVGLLAGAAVLTAALAAGMFLGLDVAVRDWSDTHRPGLPYALARGFNQLGSANLMATIALILAVPLGIRTRSARPLLPIVTTYAVSHALIAPIKILCDRAAPHAPEPDAVELFAHPDGWSYPSGHVANTLIWPLLIVLLGDALLRTFRLGPLPDPVRLTLLVAPPVVVIASTTYLGFHWLTDSATAVLLGFLLIRLLRRIPWGAERVLAPPASAPPVAQVGRRMR